jgi:predicted ferric reductase
LVIMLTVVHAVAAVVAWAPGSSLDLTAAMRDVLDLPGLMTALVGTTILVLIGFVSLRAVRRRISYERWHLLHLLVYLAVGLGFVHQLSGPDLAGRRGLQIAWALLYTYAFALVLRWRVFQTLFQLWRHRLRVEDVRQESADVMSMLMSARHLDELRAQPGQFFRWRFLTRGTWRSAYPFSLSAPPTRNRLRITVWARGDGTRRLFEIPRGTSSRKARTVRSPAVAFAGRGRLIAGGVGITRCAPCSRKSTCRQGRLGVPASKEQDLVLSTSSTRSPNAPVRGSSTW